MKAHYHVRDLKAFMAEAKEAFYRHFDGCRTCIEGAWENCLCPSGSKLTKRIKNLQDDLDEYGVDP